LKAPLKFTLESIANSYAILFFSQNRVFGVMLMLASFFSPFAGLCGFLGALFSIIVCRVLQFHRESTQMGIYSFNTLLFGIGFGTFYHVNAAFVLWFLAGSFVVTLISVNLGALFARYNLPLLSLPFIAGFWLILLSQNSVYHMGLAQKSSAVLNEIFSNPKKSLYDIPLLNACVPIPHYAGLFFRALSAVIFQNSVFAGILISIGLLIHSRIHFSLTILAFIAALWINQLTGVYPDGISYYHLGANVLMVASGVGCFFLIPSARSYAWGLASIPITFLVINGLTRVFGVFDLPVLSLPFCFITLSFIIFFRLRMQSGKLQLTPIQHYSPERNLYQLVNAEERLHEFKYARISLPFMGTWTVSQGYDGDITHKSAWGKAVDFVIMDDELKTYRMPGTEPAYFHCYSKPVLACADGAVEEVIDHIDDNPIGHVNLAENWGNSIVIKHAEGLYSQVSHLKKNSAKVKSGDFVKQGDVIGLCGNSGRSPEPHLHFQVQTTADVGSKTIPYPFTSYISWTGNKPNLRAYQSPSEGSRISPLQINRQVKQAFNLQPGYTAILSSAQKAEEEIEVFTDAWNQSYIRSKQTGATAWFVNNGNAFYFTGFYGTQRSLLYYFYLAAYKIVFTADEDLVITDSYPLQVMTDRWALWQQDLVAPFTQLVKLVYTNTCMVTGKEIVFRFSQHKQGWAGNQLAANGGTTVCNGTITAFNVNINGVQTDVKWKSGSIY
jgi:urea transporter